MSSFSFFGFTMSFILDGRLIVTMDAKMLFRMSNLVAEPINGVAVDYVDMQYTTML